MLRPVPLRTAGAIGLAGSATVLFGVALPGSPFTARGTEAWFFGTSPGSGPSIVGADHRFAGLLLVYGGIAVMLGSWFEMVRTLRRSPDSGLGAPIAIAVAWAAPILAMPPLFSRDVYSYAAQGEMVQRGINPYSRTPSALGGGPFLRLVDPMWRHVPAPYGPAWERLSGWVVGASGHDVLAALVGFRLVALVGIALIAWGVPVLAESVGRSGTVAFTLAVLNPLVLLVLLGGAHNDALMLGLLVAGCAVARRHHVFVGLVLCAMAAEVKVPALIGAVFIGWWWSGPGSDWRRRAAHVVGAVLFGAVVMVAIGAVSGLGWRWLSGLSNPGVVVSWLDPATAVGLLVSRGADGLGLSGHQAGFVQGARAVGLGLAAVTSLGLLVRSRRVGDLSALGWSLLLFVVLGPVVWPWYETWGFVFLAVVAEGWVLRLVLALSAVACFADVPAAHLLAGPDPVATGVGWFVLAAGVTAYGVTRLLPSLPSAPFRRQPAPPRPVSSPPGRTT
jgi:hypothetical protein